jgi:hypothetical protein
MNLSALENLSERERRKFPRYLIESEVSLSIEDIRSGEPIGFGEARDLSVGGLRVSYPSSHPQVDIGNRLGVLLMEDELLLFVQAEVIHHGTKDSYGLEFRDLTIADQKEIQRLVQRIAH